MDLLLDRKREFRSQFVFTTARGREMVFWQSARTAKQARPSVRVPTARASGHELHVLVDTRERYPWKFADQQATTAKQVIPVGDYAVEVDGRVVAVVERKSADDLVSTIVGGKFWMLLAELAAFALTSFTIVSARLAPPNSYMPDRCRTERPPRQRCAPGRSSRGSPSATVAEFRSR